MMSAIGFRCRGESRIKIALQQAKEEQAQQYYALRNDDSDDWGKLYQLIEKVERLEFELECEEYEDARHRNWR